MLIKTLYLNGQIFTGSTEQPFAEAMVVSLGSINSVGSNAEVLAGVGAASIDDPKLSELEVIDLAGRTVIPGFIDADIRPTMAPEEFEASWNKEEALISEIKKQGQELSSLGIVGIAVDGTYQDRDIYNCYFEAQDQGLMQYISVYYPVEFLQNTSGDPVKSGLFEDKNKLVRDRKLHIAGIKLPREEELSSEKEEFALDICRKNGIQLSVAISGEEEPNGLIDELKRKENWMEESEVPNIRVHKGLRDFVPFTDIKKDLIENLNGAAERGESSDFIDLSTEVRGYTKYAAIMSGFANLGEIKAGNKACFVITDKSLASISVEDLDKVKPEVTIIDGRIAYKSKESTFSLRDNSSGGESLKLTK